MQSDFNVLIEIHVNVIDFPPNCSNNLVPPVDTNEKNHIGHKIRNLIII